MLLSGKLLAQSLYRRKHFLVVEYYEFAYLELTRTHMIFFSFFLQLQVAGRFTYGVMALSAATFTFWNLFGAHVFPSALQNGSPMSLALQLSCSVLVCFNFFYFWFKMLILSWDQACSNKVLKANTTTSTAALDISYKIYLCFIFDSIKIFVI